MSFVQWERKPLHAVSRNTTSGAATSGGEPTSISELPAPDTIRWTIKRKAAVVAGVRKGLIGMEDACKRYGISTEEFLSWQRLIDSHGLRGLRVTRIQEYRQSSKRE